MILAGGTIAVTARAQQVVAPTPAAVGSARGEDVRGYNVVNSFETGYRFHTVDGNQDRYRSDVNYGNGIRLLQSNLTVNSKDGGGRFFDELLLNTQGLGNDPYQFVRFRLQRNKLYRYDGLWRSSDYVNPGLSTGALGGHSMDTRRQWQDHDFTLFPQSALRLLAGYSRNSQDGPSLTSIQLFESRGDEFPLFSPVARQQTEFRLGAVVAAAGFQLTLMRGWQRFREETSARIDSPQPGANPDDNNQLNSFSRKEPYEGNTPFWRFLLNYERKKWFAAGGRFSYAGGRRDFFLEETSSGTGRFGAAQNRQVMVSGSGRRPVSSGALTLSVFPSGKLTVTNHSAYHQVRMDGDATLTTVNNGAGIGSSLQFRFLGIRTLTNSIDASYRVNPWLGVYGGHRYSTRRIRSREGFAFNAPAEVASAEQYNHLNAGVAGLRFQPFRPLTLSLDAEVGRSDQPFTQVNERDYHVLGARVQYRSRTVQLAAYTRANYNFNSTSLLSHSSRGRNYSLDGSWFGRSWISVDAGYSKLHLDTLTGIAYFASARLVEGDRSFYVSNVHAGNLNVRLAIGKRADLMVGYSRIQDAGDGRAPATKPPSGAPAYTQAEAFVRAQSFPLAYGSPQARISVKLHDKLRWNLGYQHYEYREEFQPMGGYRAHTGYTSVLWSF
ncbi:MAG: hypothetical protein JJE04_08805 [Acidobacteriia bacterium]|nr:hypothetical protein [Terriglobia bacterium]